MTHNMTLERLVAVFGPSILEVLAFLAEEIDA